jgi:hypothetical protein
MTDLTAQINHVAEAVAETMRPELPGKNGRPAFNFNGLATPPMHAIRSFWGLFGKLDVPPGSWGVCYQSDVAPAILETGSHWLMGRRSAEALVQWVDATQHRHALPAVSGVSLDGWKITLEVQVIFQVNDPLQIVQVAEPLATLEAVCRAAILAQIETMPHEALLGSVKTPGAVPTNFAASQGAASENHSWDEGMSTPYPPADAPGEAGAAAGASAGKTPVSGRGLDVVERGIFARLTARASLDGLKVIDVAVTRREGDERLVGILQGEALARLQATENHQTEAARAELSKMRLEMQVQTAQAQRMVSLIEAETQAQLANFAQQKRLLEAQTEAQMQEIRQAQEAREAERRRLAEEWRTAKELDLKSMEYQHAETLAVIEGTAQVTTEAAKHGLLPGVQTQSRHIEMGGNGDPDAVATGIQALRGFRETITPPTTHFLPRPAPIQVTASVPERIETETARLERIQYLEHDFIMRHGQLRGAQLSFTADAPAALAGVRVEITCPEAYPILAPEATVHRNGESRAYPATSWQPELYLADLVREIMLEVSLAAAQATPTQPEKPAKSPRRKKAPEVSVSVVEEEHA